MSEVLKLLIDDKGFLNSLYGFAFQRTNNSYDAEDLCADIVVSVLRAAQKNSDITNPHAFVWTIARRVYADYCKKRKATNGMQNNIEYCDEHTTNIYNPIEEYIESENDSFLLKKIMHEVCFLSRIYREVAVMYYLEEMKVSDIASKLGVSQNTVKQRLYSARETIKKGVNKKMDTTNLTLKPINLYYVGNGNPVGNSPSEFAMRSFSKNLVYLCKDTERTIKELSELLSVPMTFVEEEVAIQVRGQNGRYGLLRKTENDKYISNVAIIDYDDYVKVNNEHKDYANAVAKRLKEYIVKNKQKLISLPFLNKQTDTKLIAWPLVKSISGHLSGRIANDIKEKYLSDVTPSKREYTVVCVAFAENQSCELNFYGWDGIGAKNICGYSYVNIDNMYGKHLNAHFHCGHNLYNDLALQYAAKAVGGLKVSDIPPQDKEAVAISIEAGYIKKEYDTLYPLILVSDKENIFNDTANDFLQGANDLIEPFVDTTYQYVKKYLPKHMLGDYSFFIDIILSELENVIVENCIDAGIITPPTKPRSPEGVVMTVTK